MENKNKFTAIHSSCVQIGTETWKQVYDTKVFDNSNSIQDVLDWARNITNNQNIGISDIIFAVYYE